jgi:hypothetical protein
LVLHRRAHCCDAALRPKGYYDVSALQAREVEMRVTTHKKAPRGGASGAERTRRAQIRREARGDAHGAEHLLAEKRRPDASGLL